MVHDTQLISFLTLQVYNAYISFADKGMPSAPVPFPLRYFFLLQCLTVY